MDPLFSDMMQNWYILIIEVGKNEISEKGLFVWMMLPKRQGVWNLVNYSLNSTSGNIQIFQITFFFAEVEQISYMK